MYKSIHWSSKSVVGGRSLEGRCRDIHRCKVLGVGSCEAIHQPIQDQRVQQAANVPTGVLHQWDRIRGFVGHQGYHHQRLQRSSLELREQGLRRVHWAKEGGWQEGIGDDQSRENTVGRVVQLTPWWWAWWHRNEGWRAHSWRCCGHPKGLCLATMVGQGAFMLRCSRGWFVHEKWGCLELAPFKSVLRCWAHFGCEVRSYQEVFFVLMWPWCCSWCLWLIICI